ncbi:polysaccharide biosynthesis protein [Halomonas sp. A29]|uniref:polysaccharide biosynthesis protein n=1 Tax=Halomonas sp. A29 TaxID=3102786 RepID=UPI00398B7EA3
MHISLQPLLVLPRCVKRRVLVAIDGLIVVTGLLLAAVLHRESLVPLIDLELWSTSLIVAVTSIVLFHWLGLYRVVIRYMNHTTVLIAALAVVASALVVLLVTRLKGPELVLPIVITYALLVLLGVGGVRFVLRELYLHSQRCKRRPVVIYGAGAAGSELVAALRHGSEYEPVAFVDDWRGLNGTLVEGLRVHQPVALAALIAEYKADMVLLAIPSAPRCRRREILQRLSALSVPVKTIPGSADVISGRASISEVRDVALEDLLGREPVPPFSDLMDAEIRGKTVMVTGAGGSIGSELCRQILTQQPARLLLLDKCEFALFAIEQELLRHPAVAAGIELKPLLASVQSHDALTTIFDTFAVHTVYHAAAYKHVPMVEYNLVEGLRNNVFGTLELAQAAMQGGVATFVMVSTDKAVRPTNVMGASKRLAELICQAFSRAGSQTRFCMVRFGNVLGSSGSVVPRFRQQIEQGGPVEVTHPDITRYFMTIPEAAQLVIQAGAMGSGGEVFVLDMGEPVRIRDLAVNMIRLSGLTVKDERRPGGDIEIIYTGLRPGEKLFEELLIGGAAARTCHDRILTSSERYWEWPMLEAFLHRLERALASADHSSVRQLLQAAPLDYRPTDGLADLIWRERQARLLTTAPYPAQPSRIPGARQVPRLSPLTKGG